MTLALGRSSRLVRIRNEGKPAFMRYLLSATDNKNFPEGGGVLIRGNNGEVVGAVGVTGDTEERDEELAAHGVRLRADRVAMPALAASVTSGESFKFLCRQNGTTHHRIFPAAHASGKHRFSGAWALAGFV